MSPFYTNYQEFWDCLLDSGNPVHFISSGKSTTAFLPPSFGCSIICRIYLPFYARQSLKSKGQLAPTPSFILTIISPGEAHPCITSSPSVYESLLANKTQQRWWRVTLWPPSYFRRVFHTEGGGLWQWPWRTRLPYCGKVCETDTWHGVCMTPRDWKHP